MIARILTLALAGALAAAPAALAMGSRPEGSPPPSSAPEANAAATLTEMEEAAGHVLILGPRLTFETPKGSFTIVTFPQEAPQSVEQVVRLVEAGFYDGLKVHRVVPGIAVQLGDPATRNLAVDDPKVGKGGSGHALPPEYQGQTVKHLTGTVGMARGKSPNSADSQFYITLQPVAHLNQHYTVIGQVLTGMDVVKKLDKGDVITRATVSLRPAPKPTASPSASPKP